MDGARFRSWFETNMLTHAARFDGPTDGLTNQTHRCTVRFDDLITNSSNDATTDDNWQEYEGGLSAHPIFVKTVRELIVWGRSQGPVRSVITHIDHDDLFHSINAAFVLIPGHQCRHLPHRRLDVPGLCDTCVLVGWPAGRSAACPSVCPRDAYGGVPPPLTPPNTQISTGRVGPHRHRPPGLRPGADAPERLDRGDVRPLGPLLLRFLGLDPAPGGLAREPPAEDPDGPGEGVRARKGRGCGHELRLCLWWREHTTTTRLPRAPPSPGRTVR